MHILLYNSSHQGSTHSRTCNSSYVRTGSVTKHTSKSPVPKYGIWHHGHPCPHVRCSHMRSMPAHVHVSTNRTFSSHNSTDDTLQSIYPIQEHPCWIDEGDKVLWQHLSHLYIQKTWPTPREPVPQRPPTTKLQTSFHELFGGWIHTETDTHGCLNAP